LEFPVNIERATGTTLRVAAAFAAFTLSSGVAAVAGVSAGLTPPALAQAQGGPPAGGPQGGGRRMMAQALMSLGLSDDQKGKIRDIMSDVKKQNEGVTDPDTRRANYKAGFAKIETVLTPDQRTKLHAKMDAMRKEREQQQSSSS
jgi:Spy/CpxP family protein refolding chaperone